MLGPTVKAADDDETTVSPDRRSASILVSIALPAQVRFYKGRMKIRTNVCLLKVEECHFS